jgi:hypothetical protein
MPNTTLLLPRVSILVVTRPIISAPYALLAVTWLQIYLKNTNGEVVVGVRQSEPNIIGDCKYLNLRRGTFIVQR